jgi:flagellar basal-body rod protein FlgG
MAQEDRLEVLAHNLANVATIGFKADIPLFDVISSSPAPSVPGTPPPRSLAPSPPALSLEGSYVTFAGVKTDMSQGEFRHTGNPLDLAINGKGWFSIDTSRGIRYTRKGNFTLNPEGQLVTQDGWPVLGTRGTITIEGKDIRIDPGGIITVDGHETGQLKIVEAPGDDAFQKEDSSLFAPKPGVEPVEREAHMDVKQGFLELSNVNPIKGMTALIDVMRAYESYQKVLQTFGETASRAINDVGRLR